MPATTAWERHVRRREVIRLRFGEGSTAAEIGEELGWSEATIERDLDRIREQTAQLGEPTPIREQVLVSVSHLLAHEFDDLHRAGLDDEPEAKHRAKTSFRQTLRFLADLRTELADETPSGDDRIEELPEKARDVLSEVAETEVEDILSDERAASRPTMEP